MSSICLDLHGREVKRLEGAFRNPTGIASILSVIVLVTVTATIGANRTVASSPDASARSSQQTLLFSDEFDAAQLDDSRWTTCYWWDNDGCTIVTNNELQWYQPDDVMIEGGVLRLRAQERTVQASIPNVGDYTYHYTSGMISTGRDSWETTAPIRFEYLYGYAEMRARVPAGTGLWPAFWMLSSDHEWPPELDTMEIIGSDTDTVHMNVHYLDGDGAHCSSGEEWEGPDFSEGWHTFALDWQPGAIIWYVDGVERARRTDPDLIPDEPLYLVVNLAVGGDWPGAPDASTVFPSYYEIDYVRVWDQAPSAETPTPTPTATSTPNPGNDPPPGPHRVNLPAVFR